MSASILKLTRFAFDGQTYKALVWDASLGAVPTDEQLAEIAALPDPPLVPIVPDSVTRTQFFHAAAQSNIITNAEAIAVFAGVVPASLSTAIATLSASQQFAAKIAILGNTTFERANPILIALGAAMGQTPAQIDALFTLAASL